MPQAGSFSATSANAPAAFSYPNEWRMATARLNPGCTAPSQEVAKFTLPNFPSSPAGCSCWEIAVGPSAKHAHASPRYKTRVNLILTSRPEFPISTPFLRKTICPPSSRVNLQSPLIALAASWKFGPPKDTPHFQKMVYASCMGRTNIEIDESLVRKARKLTRLKTKREIVDAALELLVRSESRKGILRHYGTGIWKGDLKAMRRNRARSKDDL